jgi:hypothetical protein
MDDFLRSMKGEAGPRIARGVIKRMRNWSITAIVSVLSVCVAIGCFGGAQWVVAHSWLPLPVLTALGIWATAEGGCEAQIRHLNDLALSPYERDRMDMTHVKRMWVAGAMFAAGVVLIMIGLAARWGGVFGIVWFVVSGALVLLAFVVSPNLGRMSLGGRYGPTYDPDEDEWTGIGSWWR